MFKTQDDRATKTFLYNNGPVKSLSDKTLLFRQTYTLSKIDAAGKATNTSKVVASADSTRMSVNGVQVAAMGPDYGRADGYVGLRVNHNLDVHIDEFSVAASKTATLPAKKKAARKMKTKG